MELFSEKTGEVAGEAGQGTGRNQGRMEKFQVNSQLSMTLRGTP